MCSNKTLCLLLLAIAATSLSAQEVHTNQLDSFTAKLITAGRANATEQAYLVTDKSVYKAGEYIWFNTLLLNTRSQRLSNNSKLLFVDVVDENDNVIKRMMLDATNQQLYSRLQLPDSLSGGYYWLRAYTRQMAVQDTNNIGIKPLYILDKEDNRSKKNKENRNINDHPSLMLYPEGGNMITGIDATVAVAATDKTGAPLSINGLIKDNRDTLVTTFSTNALGLAKFQFEPSGFRQYKAVVNYEGKEWSYPLPAFDYYKGQLSVTKQPGTYQLRVLLGDSIYKKDAVTYVAGISKDSLVFAAFGRGLYQVNIDESKLPSGITTFYLFDTEFNLLSERSVYVNSSDVQVKITTDKTVYAKRDKVNLNVFVLDASQHPIPALISVAVSDSVFTGKPQCNVPDLTTSGTIDNLFLATHDCFTGEDADLLMLTYNNTYAKLNKPVEKSVIEAGDSSFYISGKVLSAKSNGADKIVTFISNAGNNDLFFTDTTDNSGHFSFAVENLPDSMQYALGVKDVNNHALDNAIAIDNLTYPELKTPVAVKQVAAVSIKAAMDKFTRQYDLQSMEENSGHLPPVTVKGEKAADYDVSKRVSPFSEVFSGKDFDGRTSADNVVLRASGLQLVNGYLLMRGLFSIKGSGAATEPLLIVDGAPVYVSANSGVGVSSPVLSYLSNLNPREIDFIEVLKDGSAANYGVRGANGVILVNTTNKTPNFHLGDNMRVFYASGVSRPAIFPVRLYNEKDKKAALGVDNRSTIFWNGHFLTNNDGNALFSFYTSDVPATYTVTITGITQHGDVIYKTVNFKSK